MKNPILQDWVWVESMLNRSLIGAITSNFRQIVLSFEKNLWMVHFFLEEKNIEDIDECNEIVEEFSIYMEDIKSHLTDIAYTKAIAKIEVSSVPLSHVETELSRIIFRKKEV